jgi:alpha/beta superfamily hydrolase
METRVIIPCGDIELEGMFGRREGKSGVIVTHPHPLYGGDMDNPVVTTIADAYARAGYSTLRFNFRGVGRSGGTFDNGGGERLDLLAAIDFLTAEGITTQALSGYSFGAWVLSGLSPAPAGLLGVVMVSPPVSMMDFDGANHKLPGIHAITGSHDDIAPPEAVETLLERFSEMTDLTIIDGADHFYSGHLPRLSEVLSNFI